MRTREALQATIEEIETTNEELHSVNAEHFRQNTELVKLTRDFDALLRVSKIGVLFLDETYAIRRFTRPIGELFQLTDADIERPIHTFRNPFPEFDLEAMLGRVMRHGQPQEANVQDGALRGWLLRVARYPDQKGIVLSVVSLGGIRPADHTLSHENARLLAEAAPYAGDALLVVDPEDGRILFANGRAQMMYGVPEPPPDTLELSRLTPERSTPTWVGWLGSINVGASGAHRRRGAETRAPRSRRLLTEACEILCADARGADIKAKFGPCGFVRGDRILVTRLFQNLLQNALKFHKPGEAATVRVMAGGDAETVKLIFEDEGLGVNPAQADCIFEMFGRGEEANSVDATGSGWRCRAAPANRSAAPSPSIWPRRRARASSST